MRSAGRSPTASTTCCRAGGTSASASRRTRRRSPSRRSGRGGPATAAGAINPATKIIPAGKLLPWSTTWFAGPTFFLAGLIPGGERVADPGRRRWEGTTTDNRGEGGRLLKNAGPSCITSGSVAKPDPELDADGPADPILPQPRLPRTGAGRAGQHPHP